jgi:hypothetical protein
LPVIKSDDMKTTANHAMPLRYWAFLLLASGLLAIAILPRPAISLSQYIQLRTSPPSAVEIELSEADIAAITQAYQFGFDHPEPKGNDPCRRLQLLPHKKLSAWRKQFRKRGFTVDKIKDMLRTGRREAFAHPEKGTTFTKIYDPQGNWIVVDFA